MKKSRLPIVLFQADIFTIPFIIFGFKALYENGTLPIWATILLSIITYIFVIILCAILRILFKVKVRK